MAHDREPPSAEHSTPTGFPWRSAVPFVLPFGAFLGLTTLESVENYVAVYSLKIALCTGLWWWFRRAYPGWSRSGMGLALALGVAGLPVWVLLSRIPLGEVLPGFLVDWMAAGDRVGFDPFRALADGPAWGFAAVRLFGMAVTVPLIEELFWRGFLLRFLIDEQFETVPVGTFTVFSFASVTLLFAVVHPEFLAALAWGAGVNWLLYRTRNVWACVLAHAATNLLLGIYVIRTGSWWLW